MNVRRQRFAREVIIFVMLLNILNDGSSAEQGAYFAKRKYVPKPLPTFNTTEDKLPSPIYDEDPNYVRCYWKAWELAFRNFHEPAPQSGYVSQFIEYAIGIKADAGADLVIWDIKSPRRLGIDNFWFGQKTVSLVCREPGARGSRTIKVRSGGDFRLTIRLNGKTKTVEIKAEEPVEVEI